MEVNAAMASLQTAATTRALAELLQELLGLLSCQTGHLTLKLLSMALIRLEPVKYRQLLLESERSSDLRTVTTAT